MAPDYNINICLQSIKIGSGSVPGLLGGHSSGLKFDGTLGLPNTTGPLIRLLLGNCWALHLKGAQRFVAV